MKNEVVQNCVEVFILHRDTSAIESVDILSVCVSVKVLGLC